MFEDSQIPSFGAALFWWISIPVIADNFCAFPNLTFSWLKFPFIFAKVIWGLIMLLVIVWEIHAIHFPLI
jgi:hypothetical protein